MKSLLTHLSVAAVAVALSAAVLAQEAPVVGDRTSPLNPLGGDGNVGISNATLRDQPEVRALRVVVDTGGIRAMHEHADVRFHLFVPISAPMELELEDGPVTIQPWHPFYLEGGTQHGFRNRGGEPVEIMEIFIR